MTSFIYSVFLCRFSYRFKFLTTYALELPYLGTSVKYINIFIFFDNSSESNTQMLRLNRQRTQNESFYDIFVMLSDLYK